MEANSLIDLEITKVVRELNMRLLGSAADEVEIADYFYSEIDNLTNQGLSLEEALLITRKRFGDTQIIKSEFTKTSKISNLLIKYSKIILAILFAKQLLILFSIVKPTMMWGEPLNIYKTVPFVQEFSIFFHLVLLITFGFTIKYIYRIYFKNEIQIFQNLMYSLISFEVVYVMFNNLNSLIFASHLKENQLFFSILINSAIVLISIVLFYLSISFIKDRNEMDIAVDE